MNKIALCIMVSALFAGSVSAVRYQANHLERMYFSTQEKTEVVGEGTLFCPSYDSPSQNWIVDGIVTPYYNEYVGPKCITGPVPPRKD
jgi:hypothetical protein